MKDAKGWGWVAGQAALYALYLLAPAWTPWRAPAEARLLGTLLLAAGAVVAALACLQLGRGLTVFPKPPEGASLRTGGLYGLVRHPVYLGVILLAAGWALLRFDLARLILAAAGAAYLDRKAGREEEFLRARFPEYEEYARRVGKLIPGLRAFGLDGRGEPR